MAETKRRDSFVAIAMGDRRADFVRIDRVEDAAPMTLDAPEALAATAVNFRAPSAAAAKYPNLHALGRATTFKYLLEAGGLPVVPSGRLTGAIGVSGAYPEECEAIARTAIGG